MILIFGYIYIKDNKIVGFHILQRIYSTDKQKILFSFVNKYRDTACQVLPLQLVQGKLSQSTNSYSVTLLL